MNGLRILRILLRASTVAGYRRVGYLIVTVAVAVAAWLALAAMTVPFLGSAQTQGAVVTIRNSNQTGTLPLPYTRRIEGMHDAFDVTWMAIQVVECKQSPMVPAVLFGYGGPGTEFTLTHGKYSIDAATFAHWEADPLAIVVTSKIAAACGWHVGESVEPPELTGTKHMQLHIIGIIHGSRIGALAHFDYINRIGPFLGKNKVAYISARAKTVRGNELLAARIEATFAHDFPSVEATTNTTVQGAFARFGKVQELLGWVAIMILLCAATVLVSVLAHTAAQRRPRYALLQVLGFRRSTLFAAVVLEGFLIIVIGAAIGTALGQVAARTLVDSTAIGSLLGGTGLKPPVWAYLWMLPWLAGLLIATLIAPARLIAQVRAADYRVT